VDVTININLTPVEARQLVGLPDVQPLQQAALAKVEERVLAQAETFSVDGMLNSWFGGGTGTAVDMFRDVVRGVFSEGSAKDKTSPKSK